MNFLFDTTAFSDLMREHPGLDAHLATISPTDDRIVICSVVRGEILYGIGRLRHLLLLIRKVGKQDL
jgi:predicted nucleic acid-binding protein